MLPVYVNSFFSCCSHNIICQHYCTDFSADSWRTSNSLTGNPLGVWKPQLQTPRTDGQIKKNTELFSVCSHFEGELGGFTPQNAGKAGWVGIRGQQDKDEGRTPARQIVRNYLAIDLWTIV